MSVNVVLRQDHAKRRLKSVRRHFTKFNCCSPQLARRRRDNAEVKIGDSLMAPDVRMEEVVIGSSFEVVIGSSLEVVIGSSLELPIFPSYELPIFPLDELPIKNNKLKNRNSRVKYRERRKKKNRLAAACLALQMVGNPTSALTTTH